MNMWCAEKLYRTRIRVVLFSLALPIVAVSAIHSTEYLCLHKKSIEVHWTPVKLLGGPSMKCSAYWRIKSGSFDGYYADPYTVFIVCASDRSRTSSSGDWLEKSTGDVYSIHICNRSSILHCQSAATFGSNGALAKYRLLRPYYSKVTFSSI